MNQTFIAPFPRQIEEVIAYCNLNATEIIEWGQALEWQDKFKMTLMDDCNPHYLIFPKNKLILSQLVTFAYENHWGVIPTGKGSKLSWGGLCPKTDFLISTVNLNQILDHAEEDLTVTVQSGMTIKDLNGFLASKGQFLPVDPFFPDSATVGGVVATANTVNWRQRYGGLRDLILGLSFVRADGQIVKAGGKVVKNVAGYDLMKLFAGSYGSLGIITDVTFRLFPIPEYSHTLVIRGAAGGIKKLGSLIITSGLTPTMADFISGYGDVNSGLAVRFQSIQPSVEQQIDLVRGWAGELNLSTDNLFEGEETNFWEHLKSQMIDGGVSCKVGILPSEAVNLLTNFQLKGFINISSGVGYIFLDESTRSHRIREIRQFCQLNGGYLSILRSPLALKQQIEPWGYLGNGLTMMKKIKEKFDPRGVFADHL